MFWFLKDEKGSAVLFELAVMLPLMIMLFYGFAMFTNALSIDIAIQTAAREGAREYAMTNNPTDGLRKAMLELEASKVDGVTIEPFTEGDGRGIRIIKELSFIIPFSGEHGGTLEGVGLFIEEPER